MTVSKSSVLCLLRQLIKGYAQVRRASCYNYRVVGVTHDFFDQQCSPFQRRDEANSGS